jgi:competence protein ComEC
VASGWQPLDNFGYYLEFALAAMKRFWLVFICGLVAGLSSLAIQYSAARPELLKEPIANVASGSASFLILDSPRYIEKFQIYQASVKLLSFDLGTKIETVSVRGEISGGTEFSSVATGQIYSCRLELRPAESNGRSGFRSSCKDKPRLQTEAKAPQQFITSVRNSFLDNARGVTPESMGLVAGLAIGDTTLVSQELKDAMKAVSLTHLTAVSGANCAIVLAMAYLLIRRLGGGKWVRLSLGLLTLVAYVLLVGAQPSVLRAAVMAAAVLIAISLGRKSAALAALALAVMVLLIADPWLATDYGFLLSAAATAGLLILTEPLVTKFSSHMPKWLAICLAIAISAQVFCLPILLQLQSGLATYSIPANILAEPLVAPITVLGITAVVFSIPVPWLSQLLFYLASFGASAIVWIAQFFSELPLNRLAWPTGVFGALAALAVILASLIWLRAEPTGLRNIGITSLAIISAISFGAILFGQVRSITWSSQNWTLVNCDVGQGDALVIRSKGAVALVDVGRTDKQIDSCLTELGISRIDLLVLTHFDLDHVGGVRGAVDNRSIGTVLISPFKDERWAATGTNTYLNSLGLRMIEVEKGTSGQLGNFSWTVLSPNKDAAGSEDSNDASVAMFWESPEFNLLTLADTGEKAQMRMSATGNWLRAQRIHKLPLVLKVAHHGSADQYPELIEELRPDLSLVSVGAENSYGHPTKRTLNFLEQVGSVIARTDLLGSVAISPSEGGLAVTSSRQD